MGVVYLGGCDLLCTCTVDVSLYMYMFCTCTMYMYIVCVGGCGLIMEGVALILS